MHPGERMQFFDELPEETWQTLMDELGAKEPAPSAIEVPEPLAPAVAPEPAIIEARRIEKGFERPDGGEMQVIAPTDLSVEPGVITALLGPSGSGKSTLLRILSGLAAPTRGEVLWHGQPLAESAPNVAIVFQSFALFPWLTVLDNVEVPLLARGMRTPAAPSPRPRARRSVGLQGFRERLSQGAVRRHETARGFRARAGRGAGNPVHGRALLRARRPHRREPARRAAGTVARQEDSHAEHFPGHPQHRGSRPAGGPHHRSGPQPGPASARISASPSSSRATAIPPSSCCTSITSTS